LKRQRPSRPYERELRSAREAIRRADRGTRRSNRADPQASPM